MINALQEQNIEIPSGQLGRPPAPADQKAFRSRCASLGACLIRVRFEQIIVKNTPNGLVQLKDVGHAQLGAETYDTNLEYSGHEAIGVGVQ